MPHAPAHAPDRLARCVAAVVGAVARRPVLTLAVGLLLAAGSGGFAAAKLGYHTQRNDLLSPDKGCQQRWQRYLDAFGDDDDMVVVAEGPGRARMAAALDAVAERVKARPDLFDRVFHRTDLRNLHDRALLFLPTDQLAAVKDRVDRMGPLLGPLAPVAWPRLNLQSLLGTAGVAVESDSPPSPADADLLAQLPAVARAAAAAVRDPAAYRNPWALAGAKTADRDAEKELTEPRYSFTPDGTLAVLLCRPAKAASFTPAKEANAAMRALLAEIGPAFPDVKLGLTGLPVLETDEMVRSDEDSTRAAWLALLGVAGLYFVVYRGARYPLLTVGSLAVGTAWALGWATLTVGHLNILSAAFAVMLIGLGDYGVLWVARYDDARRRGLGMNDALQDTAEHAGPGIVTAAATTALAFFATTFADFKAVAELGWIAGSGVLLCAASCLTLVPAALVLMERRRPPVAPDAPVLLPFPVTAAWLPGLAARPRLVLGCGAALVLAAAGFALRVGYDHNLLHLQADDLDSVRWEHRLIERSAGMTWDALGIAATREDAAALKARFEAVPEVGRVVEVASLIPADQDAKLPILAAIRDRLGGLPPAERVPPPRPYEVAAARDWAARLTVASGDVAAAAGELLAALTAVPADVAAERLAAFDRRLAADLAADLNTLRAVSRPAPITLADLPPELRERYVGAGGEFLVRAFARDSLWDHDALRRFTAAAAAAVPDATGKSFRTLEGLDQMKRGFERAGLYALFAIAAVLLLDLRRVADLALALLPLAAGAVLTLGVMGIFGVPLNPANMIALPLVVGVGVDNGVHVLHDYRARRGAGPYRLGAATGRGVLVAGLTTVLGFGTLMTARHVGMAGLGLVLTLGVTFSMAAALVGLPAVLRLRDERRAKRERARPVDAFVRRAA